MSLQPLKNEERYKKKMIVKNCWNSKNINGRRYRMTVCQAGGHNLFESKQSSKPALHRVIKWQQRCFGGIQPAWVRVKQLEEIYSCRNTENTHRHSTIVYNSLIGWQKEQSDNEKMWLLQDCDFYVSLSRSLSWLLKKYSIVALYMIKSR